ncbi:MAG TPA: hypothetical protein DCX06_10085 [Opitutae bacterium]|nr:hypothetical protein [Opitutae bacterium]
MKLLPEDPRITAYALGEIADEQERKEIEAAVKESPELQQAVAAIQEMGDLLGASFADEVAPELSEFEKAAMEVEPRNEKPVGRLLSWPVLSSAAAIALLAILLVPQLLQKEEDYTFQAPERADAQGSKEYREVDVSIPAELIEGTPMPINAKNLEPAPTAAPRMIMEMNAPKDEDSAVASASTKLKLDLQQAPTVEASAVEYEELADSVALGASASSSGYSNLVTGTGVTLSRGSQQATAGRVSLAKQVASPALVDRFSIAEGGCFPELQPKPQLDPKFNTETYDVIEETDFRSPLVAPLSTFSIDVDTASYANVRRFLNQGQLPPADAVRIEELINYFNYSDAAPSESLEEGGDPFAVHMAQSYAPWNSENRLLRIALKGYEMPWEERPASNLVFLLDVSGSMNQQNKLPLVKEAMGLLIRRLDERDRVAIVVYAGASGLVLPSTTANNHETIEYALNNLKAGGSTNAGAGIELAYKTARKHFIEGGNNRVILCTDGDFNVGTTHRGDLATIAEEQADEGVSLTVLGFGMGNYKDGMLETLSNKGKGTYAYVDSQTEARKVFLEDLASNIFKIAKDVKIQVEFNSAQVKAYRLIGYENRRLKAEDFNNDAKKAGDIGPGHTVVALYEIVPPSADIELPGVDTLRYQAAAETELVPSEVATVKLRYKQPDGDVSKLITHAVSSDEINEMNQSSEDLRFSAAVAAFGLKLSSSESAEDYGFGEIRELALKAQGKDIGGHRSEFIDLVRKAGELSQ